MQSQDSTAAITEPVPSNPGLRRDLKNRHLQLIALGGAIGTGLFYGSVGSISLAGPAVILCYLLGGALIFLIMRALGEMSVHKPSSGAFSEYAYEYWSPRAGFVSGWNYWFNYIAVSMAELTVVGTYVQFWFPNFPAWASAAIFLVAITAINLISVKAYGEFEFWFAIIKVVAIIAMIVLGLVIIVAGVNGPATGIHNLWSNGGFAPNGIGGMALAMVVVMFSFGGVELVGIAAGEAEDPKRTIPKAINGVVHRILIFYIGAIAVMLSIFPWNQLDPNQSPFVSIFERIGIPSAALILNIVVLTAAMSAYNSGLYSNGRMLYSLARQGNAPRFLARVNRYGSPYMGVLVSSAITSIAVILVFALPNAFPYVMSIALIAGIINWTMVIITHHKFRQHLGAVQVAKLDFKMPGAPVTGVLVLVGLAAVVVLMGMMEQYVVALIVGPIWLAILLIGYQLKKSGSRSAAEPAEH